MERFEEVRTLEAADGGEIAFLCLEEDREVIPDPKPASEYRNAKTDNLSYNSPLPVESRELTDAVADSNLVSRGWILSAPGEFQMEPGESGVELVTSHFGGEDYVQTYKTGAESTASALCASVNTRWAIDVPEGYGLLSLPPTVVKQDFDFEVISQLVDVGLAQRWLRVPVTAQESTYVRYGTPLCHVIPLKLDELDSRGSIE